MLTLMIVDQGPQRCAAPAGGSSRLDARAGGLPGSERRHCARARSRHRGRLPPGAGTWSDFEACIAHLRFPAKHRRAIRTTNLLERLFVEERRRLKIIPNAFGERAVLKLMFGALIRAAERWRSIKITEFERRQLTATRKELDQEYETQIGLKHKLSKDTTSAKISSTLRT